VSHRARNDHVAPWLTKEREAGRALHAFAVDAADHQPSKHSAARVLAELGRVAVPGNNAGITPDATSVKWTTTMPDADIRRTARLV
ncbi:beta-ketoacyl-ACP reductase, partial [Burkholderia cenocepacia]